MDLSTGALAAQLVVSTVGFGFFLYGKKQLRYPQLVVGLVMAIFPYFATGAAMTWSIGGALLLVLAVLVRAGK